MLKGFCWLLRFEKRYDRLTGTYKEDPDLCLARASHDHLARDPVHYTGIAVVYVIRFCATYDRDR